MAVSARSQDSSAFFKNTYPAGRYFLSYVTDGANMAVAPLKWSAAEVGVCAGVAAGTILLMSVDEDIYHQMFSDSRVDDVSKYGLENFGDGLYSLPLLAGLYAGGKILKSPYDCEVALLGLKTFAVNGIATRVIKYSFQRHRPDADTPPDAYAFEGPFHGITEHKSFVSGHASSAFALAAVLSCAYGKKKKWVPWVAWPLASLVALSRVYDGSHWASDVFAGAAFGYASGMFMYKFNINDLR